MAHIEIGRDVLLQILTNLDELDTKYNVDRKPQMEGRFMSMILSPKSKK
jgi:translation initiation factor IF-3